MDIYIVQGIRPDRMLTELCHIIKLLIGFQPSQSSHLTKCAATGHVAIQPISTQIVTFPNSSPFTPESSGTSTMSKGTICWPDQGSNPQPQEHESYALTIGPPCPLTFPHNNKIGTHHCISQLLGTLMFQAFYAFLGTLYPVILKENEK